MVAFNPRLDGYKNIKRLLEEGVEVVAGGFPCQDISTAGRGAGLAGERSGLWREMLRTIRLVRPRYAIVENVAALLSRGMGTVLGDLAKSGYDTEWYCISAADVGAPHKRERIWIVAHTESFRYGLRRKAGNIPKENGGQIRELRPELVGASSKSKNLAHANSSWEPQPEGAVKNKRRWVINDGENVADSLCSRLSQQHETRNGGPQSARIFSWSELERAYSARGKEQWGIEPNVGRVADGVPARVDRLKGLGNAVVPQIPEIIGQAIMTIAESYSNESEE